MRKVKMLDCTLRDGGCVNDFNFGCFYMKQILDGIERSGIEIIELGYIDSKAGSEEGRTQYCNDHVITKNFLQSKKNNITYVAMIDYGKYDPDLLQLRNESSIDGIRLAFHKKDRKKILDWGRKILGKGYQLFIQPMTCVRYSDWEMLDLINDINTCLPEVSAFYIVDSFGEMKLKEMNRIANLIDHNLNEGIPIGLHSHNNLQLSYSNAVTLLGFPMNRDVIFDSSIMGMGKGAGNMTTELFAEHLNNYEGKTYNIEPLLETIDTVINQIRENYSWGYSVEYYLSANNHCTPSYASHYYKKHMLSIRQVSELLSLIKEEKKISFDKIYADELYYEYNAKTYDDHENLKILVKRFHGKKILVVAPGKSVLQYKREIENVVNSEDVISIALNNNPVTSCDFAFVTKNIVYNILKNSNMKIIMSSNVPVKEDKIISVNYESLTQFSGGVSDNSTIMLINLLVKCGVKKVILAGFDGFSSDADDNYYDEALKRPIEKNQAKERNKFIKDYLNEMMKIINITYLTPSKYQ